MPSGRHIFIKLNFQMQMCHGEGHQLLECSLPNFFLRMCRPEGISWRLPGRQIFIKLGPVHRWTRRHNFCSQKIQTYIKKPDSGYNPPTLQTSSLSSLDLIDQRASLSPTEKCPLFKKNNQLNPSFFPSGVADIPDNLLERYFDHVSL